MGALTDAGTRGRYGLFRVALAKQPFSPNGTSKGPTTMARAGSRASSRSSAPRCASTRSADAGGGAGVRRLEAAGLRSATWPRVQQRARRLLQRRPARHVPVDARDGRRPAAVWPDADALRIGMLWLDAHPDFNTPETTRSGSLGGMPVAVATGRACTGMRLDAGLDPPLADRARRHGRRAPHRSARAGAARQVEDPAAERGRSADAVAGGARAARSAEPARRQDLRPHRHGRARSARGRRPHEQGAQRPIERASWRSCSR